jgi:hypothetical protein
VARTVVHGQWDIALRDLDFVLKLDDNGDGKIVWGELRQHQTVSLLTYAYGQMSFFRGWRRHAASSPFASGRRLPRRWSLCGACSSTPNVQRLQPSTWLTVDYKLFFKD